MYKPTRRQHRTKQEKKTFSKEKGRTTTSLIRRLDEIGSQHKLPHRKSSNVDAKTVQSTVSTSSFPRPSTETTNDLRLVQENAALCRNAEEVKLVIQDNDECPIKTNKHHTYQQKREISSRFSGESVRTDVPCGLDDTVERFMRAVSIRCFVSNFWKIQYGIVTGIDAHSRFLGLDSCLEKIQHERQSWAWVKLYIDQLHDKGITSIMDLIEVSSKITNLLKTLEPQPSDEFLGICGDLLSTLRTLEPLRLNRKDKIAKKFAEFRGKLIYQATSDDDEEHDQFSNLAGKINDKSGPVHEDRTQQMREYEESLPGSLWSEKKFVNINPKTKHLEEFESSNATVEVSPESHIVMVNGIARDPSTGLSYQSSRTSVQNSNKSATNASSNHPIDNLKEVSTHGNFSDDGDGSNFRSCANRIRSRFKDQMANAVKKLNCEYGEQNKLNQERKTTDSVQRRLPTSYKYDTSDKFSKRSRGKSWIVPYTERIISENRSKFPVYDQYRKEPQLCIDGSLNIDNIKSNNKQSESSCSTSLSNETLCENLTNTDAIGDVDNLFMKSLPSSITNELAKMNFMLRK